MLQGAKSPLEEAGRLDSFPSDCNSADFRVPSCLQSKESREGRDGDVTSRLHKPMRPLAHFKWPSGVDEEDQVKPFAISKVILSAGVFDSIDVIANMGT